MGFYWLVKAGIALGILGGLAKSLWAWGWVFGFRMTSHCRVCDEDAASEGQNGDFKGVLSGFLSLGFPL